MRRRRDQVEFGITQFAGPELRWLATRIRSAVDRPVGFRRTDVFVCGASLANANSARARLHHFFEQPLMRYRFAVHIPERMFEDLSVGKKVADLLSLENVLAGSADAVILVVESAGSLAELGAFANHPDLRSRLIAVLDAKHRADRSFVMKGPVSLLRASGRDQVQFADLGNLSDQECAHIAKRAQVLAERRPRKIDTANVLDAHHFLLMCIYVLDQLSRGDLLLLLQLATGLPDVDAQACVANGLRQLLASRAISLTPDGYRFVAPSTDGLHTWRWSSSIVSYDTSALDAVRLEVLTARHRGRKIRIGAGGDPTS